MSEVSRRAVIIGGLVVATFPGMGGTPDMPAGYIRPDLPGVSAGSNNIVVARRVIIIGSGGELLVYSPSAGAGNLRESIASAAFIDQYGNHGVSDTASYGSNVASALHGGFIQFYNGSLAAGWTSASSVSDDGSGDLFLAPAAGKIVKANLNTLDDGFGNATITGTLSVNGSTSTGAGDNGGVTSGPSGTVNAFPAAGPNHTHAELHHHPL